MQNAVKKQKEPAPLLIPKPNTRIKRWIILGLDPSVSRTGFAILDVRPQPYADIPDRTHYDLSEVKSGVMSQAVWLAAGSIKPEKGDDPLMHTRNTLWARSKAIAIYLREMVKSVAPPGKSDEKDDFHVCHTPGCCKPDVGLIISMEFPTPGNDFLVSLNRIISLIMFEDGEVVEKFGEVRIMLTNASTMRSQMGLFQRGNKNKAENILKAYQFIDRAQFPQLDSDSCDAVLMAMVARHAASIMLGITSEIPENFLNVLCNAAQDVKGKGRNARTVTRGLLHRIEYWYRYERRSFKVCIKDASNPKKSLNRLNFSI